jgi:glucokinase
MADRLAAVDVGASKTLVALVQREREGWTWISRTRRFSTPSHPEKLVARIGATVRELAGPQHIVTGAGIAIPGPLDSQRGIVTHLANLGWRDIPFACMLSAEIGAAVVLDDDARLGALGEWAAGAGRGCDSLAFVTVSSGVGCGLVLAGAAWQGSHGLAGEFGHLVVDPHGPRCSCGNRGCIEAYAGGLALIRATEHAWPHGHLDDGSVAPRTPAELFRLVRRSDPVAAGIVDKAADALAVGIAAIVAVADPELIVVGGSVALGQRNWLRSVTKRARARCVSQAGAAMRVVPAGLGGHAALAGAAELAVRAASRPAPGQEGSSGLVEILGPEQGR